MANLGRNQLNIGVLLDGLLPVCQQKNKDIMIFQHTFPVKHYQQDVSAPANGWWVVSNLAQTFRVF